MKYLQTTKYGKVWQYKVFHQPPWVCFSCQYTPGDIDRSVRLASGRCVTSQKHSRVPATHFHSIVVCIFNTGMTLNHILCCNNTAI